MTIRFNVKDLPEYGLEIITSVDPAFDELSSRHFAKSAQSQKNLADYQPVSIFLRNSGKRPVVAYVLKWEMLGTNGRTTTQFSAYSQPGILLGYDANTPTVPGQRHVISPGAMRLFSPNSPIDRASSGLGTVSSQGTGTDTSDHSVKAIDARARAAMRNIRDITVSLDGAFFDDGKFVGPNTSRYFERIKAEIDAKKDLLAKFANSDKDAGTVDRAFESIRESIVNSDKDANGVGRASESLQASSDEPPPSYLTATPEALYQYYAKEYAREILNMKEAYGKETTVAHFRRLHNMRKPDLVRVLD